MTSTLIYIFSLTPTLTYVIESDFKPYVNREWNHDFPLAHDRNLDLGADLDSVLKGAFEINLKTGLYSTLNLTSIL